MTRIPHPNRGPNSVPLAEEYSGWKTKVLCHDCERYTEVPYHFFYLKVGVVKLNVLLFLYTRE